MTHAAVPMQRPKAVPRDVLAVYGGPKAVTEPIPSVLYGVDEIDQKEKRYVLDVLERKALFRWQDPKRSYVLKFEKTFARKMNIKYALAVSEGTSALITALVAAGIGPGDEVILPGYTFIASAAAVLLCGAVPVIAEIDETLTIDPRDVQRKITPYTKAVMPVHMRGIPCQMDKIMRVARKHNLLVIEDAAQACGGTFKGRSLGTIGHVGCFSMQVYKTITTGEGGVVVTNDPNLYARAALAHDSAMAFWRRLHEETAEAISIEPIPGNGYRMSELAGAVGCAQIQKLDRIINTLRKRKQAILQTVKDCRGLKPMRVPDPRGECAYSVNFLFDSAEQAQTFAEALAAEGVQVHTIHNEGFPDRHIYKYWDYVLNKTPLTPNFDPWRDPRYKGKVRYSPDMCPRTISILSRTVAVPLNQRMTARHARLIAQAVRKVTRVLCR